MDRKENYDYNACDELRCMDGVVFEYDLKGNMTKKIDPSEGAAQYAYDYQNRLFRITYPDKTQSRYYYNSGGLRTAKTDGIEPRPDSSIQSLDGSTNSIYNSTSNFDGSPCGSCGLPAGAGRTTYYYWDGTEIESIPNAINESDETGGITNTYWPGIGFKSIYNGGSSAGGGSGSAGGSSAAGGGSGLAGGGLGTAGGGQWRFFITDHLGSVIALTDEAGNITDRYEYDEYGALIKAKGTSYNPYRYIEQNYDNITGLLYLRARYYDPRTGRFINRDPIGVIGGLGHYLYSHNNPISNIDLTGNSAIGWGILISFATCAGLAIYQGSNILYGSVNCPKGSQNEGGSSGGQYTQDKVAHCATACKIIRCGMAVGLIGGAIMGSASGPVGTITGGGVGLAGGYVGGYLISQGGGLLFEALQWTAVKLGINSLGHGSVEDLIANKYGSLAAFTPGDCLSICCCYKFV